MSEKQVVNLAVFERDVYLLAAMLLADERIAGIEYVSAASADHYENEVNRLLVLLATAARQIMRRLRSYEEIMAIQDHKCGGRWSDSTKMDKKPKPLRFFQACNSIIHATAISAYDEDEGYYTDAVRILEEENADGIKPITMLDGIEFVKCCIMLSKQVREQSQKEAGADSAPGPH